MNQSMKNKEFVLEYFNAINGKEKTNEIMERYITDKVLIEHIIFFEGAFPKYSLMADEMVSEGNQVIVRARMVGQHTGQFGEIQPTNKNVDFSFVISYIIENNKITSHWMIADQMTLMEQLGVMQPTAAH